MNYHQLIKELLWQLNAADANDAVISWQFTGFISGIALALRDRRLAQTFETALRREWLMVSGPGGPYSPEIMADKFIEVFREKR